MESIGNRLYSISLCKTHGRRKIVVGLSKKELKVPKNSRVQPFQPLPFGPAGTIFFFSYKNEIVTQRQGCFSI